MFDTSGQMLYLLHVFIITGWWQQLRKRLRPFRTDLTSATNCTRTYEPSSSVVQRHSGWVSQPVAMDIGDGDPRMLVASFVTGDGFRVLGMDAYMGRLLSPADE